MSSRKLDPDTQGFWQMPPLWTWLVFVLSLVVLSASLCTWREGRRFRSRPLTQEEWRIVETALTWEDPASRAYLRELLQDARIRAMEHLTLARVQERSAFGYSDERGRILLNPHLCFAYHHSLSSRLQRSEAPADLVATSATLHHELRHLLGGASELEAYEEEWRFVRRQRGLSQQGGEFELAAEWQEWERHLRPRVALYLGPEVAQQISLRLQGE